MHIGLPLTSITDFYLGTDLPHPEYMYIRIPRSLIHPNVTLFYELEPFFNNGALYCSVHKTHYGLPQAGALSQQRLFNQTYQTARLRPTYQTAWLRPDT
jgi:hypothetical protein